MSAQHSLPFAPTRIPGLAALRERLAALQVDLDLTLDAQAVRDVSRLLDRIYPVRGERRLPQAVPEADVSLAFRHGGEHYVPEEADFVHPNLGWVLGQALQDYVQRELLDPTLLTASPEARTRRVRRIEVLEGAWEQISAALVGREEERAAHWRRPKLVLSSSWCVCARQVPRPLWDEVLQSAAQRAEWTELYGVEVPEGADVEWLAAHPTLVIDTKHFDAAFGERLLSGLGDLESARSGIVLQGDNAHALRLLLARFRGGIQCAYLDPPFNTADDGRAYADRFGRAAWLCFMEERLRLVAELLSPDGTLYAHIDGHEKERLRLLLDRHLHYVSEIIWRIGWISGFKSRAHKFIRNHDTIYHYGKSPRPLFNKRYLPYPDDYVRRDGKKPTGKGIPLEDTWNCSAADRLDSIQIMSFSREKVGKGNLTQKNENLLARMLEASSREGDWVLDGFLGSGTTCATAHKLGRRWIGIERTGLLDEVALPRLKRVLFGEPYGISAAQGWKGGGAFQVLRLETYADARANASGTGRARGHLCIRCEGGIPTVRGEPLLEPLSCRIRAEAGWTPVDVVESFSWLLGLSVRRRWRVPGARILLGEDPIGEPSLVVWLTGEAPAEVALPQLPPSGRAWINGPADLLGELDGWRIEHIEEALAARIGAREAPARTPNSG